jgi:pyruvate,orthophosphate dikinase
MTSKVIYRFGSGSADGNAAQKALLGGKGANLAEMAGLGIPVPPGFTITTEMCTEYMKHGRMPDGLLDEVQQAMLWLQQATGKQFGDPGNPLLVSVRSGARASMPGMMDTVLNLGLTDAVAAGLAQATGNERFVYDAYRRLLTMYGNVVLGLEHERFAHAMDRARRALAKEKGIDAPEDAEELGRAVPDSMLGVEQLRQVVEDFKQIIAQQSGSPFPADPMQQLEGAIKAVFESWNNKRAITYRKMHGIPDDWGTAVNVQSMVFGNMGETSATGVAFTRDPGTGERRFFGEWLPNAQGEDVVAGIRTPQPLAKGPDTAGKSLEEAMSQNYKKLFEIQEKLEQHYRDMQDLEFTIEQGKLYMLQTRNGKRTASAAVKIAVDMAKEGLISEEDAVMRVEPDRVDELLFPMIDPKAGAKPVAKGIAASPGAVTGKAVFSADDAVAEADKGEKVILVRIETSPEDIHGMKAALGILTARGGATSHAAVVARGMGKSCVAGCSGISVDYERGRFTAAGQIVNRGEIITIDGSGGRLYIGDVAKKDPELGGEFEELLKFADRAARMKVRTNADTPKDAQKALEMGAQGIGLCRTEHMFFDEERILAVREMIVATDRAAREKALAKLLPFQTEDFAGLFRVMRGLPVNIRLLDPPLHEFLPHEPDQQAEVARSVGVSPDEIRAKVSELHEFNPMLGHRGVRLAITFPEIAAMQVRAILTAACKVKREGIDVLPEIMIPLSLSKQELDLMKEVVDQVSREVFAAEKTEVDYKFGTMIELPRAALLAGELAETAEFFSFGTNDLTQTTMGLSRDDAGKFLPHYVEAGVFEKDPFVSLDQSGVGELVRIGCERGRATRPDISLGICGEHGGDPASIEFCDRVGLKYVSCSPFRVPAARIAAAQANIVAQQGDAEKGRTV